MAEKEPCPPERKSFSHADGVDLKYYFERVLAEKEKALELQAKELSRRLDLLNGEAGRLRDIQTTYLPREVADARYEQTNKTLLELTLFKNTVEAKASMDDVRAARNVGYIGIGLSIIGILLKVFWP